MAEYEQLAKELVDRNPYIAQAWDFLAALSYTRGDFTGVIQNKRMAIERNRFEKYEYETYLDMLRVGAELYSAIDDKESLEICWKEIQTIKKQLEEFENTIE